MKCNDCGTNRNVRLCQGDLHLCRICESNRFPRNSGKPDLTIDKMAESESGTPLKSTTIESRLDALCEKVDKFTDMVSTLQQLQQSVNYMNTFFEDYKKDVQDLLSENKALRKKLDMAENKLKQSENENRKH